MRQIVIYLKPSELTLCPNMVIRASVLRSIKASQCYLDPVVEDSFVHSKGAAAPSKDSAIAPVGLFVYLCKL